MGTPAPSSRFPTAHLDRRQVRLGMIPPIHSLHVSIIPMVKESKHINLRLNKELDVENPWKTHVFVVGTSSRPGNTNQPLSHKVVCPQ